ncbi:MAG: Maf family protein [Proteobacteria bacterium]|nr:Maf family protein [Pseudomonadota bacterium]
MIDPRTPGLYLASRSPRRRELLAQIDVRFELLDAEVDEAVRGEERPADYVERLARAKAEAAWARIGREGLRAAPVLAADTTVTLDGRILGKPADRREAAQMLGALSGQRHEVFTAIAVRTDSGLETAVSRSEVAFRVLEADEIRQYLDTGEADDKAGAYAIQGRAARFIVELRGSYSGVVGLPLFETARLLERLVKP